MAVLNAGSNVILDTLAGPYRVLCCEPKQGVILSSDPGGAGPPVVDPTVQILFRDGSTTAIATLTAGALPATAAVGLRVLSDPPEAFNTDFVGSAVRYTDGASGQEFTGIVSEGFVAADVTAAGAADDPRGFVVIALTGRGEGGTRRYLVVEVESDFSNVGTILEVLSDADFPRY